jgi:hypothetical protein
MISISGGFSKVESFDARGVASDRDLPPVMFLRSNPMNGRVVARRVAGTIALGGIGAISVLHMVSVNRVD